MCGYIFVSILLTDMVALLVAVLVLDDHAVDLGLLRVLGYQDALKVLRVLVLLCQ